MSIPTASRLVYAPTVTAYIQTGSGENGETVNISGDIISGSVTRRINAISSASITLQNRNMKYNGMFQPMDKIVIYMKKVKPVLVFSGYLDSVPFLQAKPGPITITASCTLKLLEFTYFDPALPYVQTLMSAYIGAGDAVAGWDPLTNTQKFFSGTTYADAQSSGEDGEANSDAGTARAEEVGFGRMLQFLVSVIGKWPAEKVHILDLPEGWIDTASALLARIDQNEKETFERIKKLLTTLLKGSSKTVSVGAGGGSGSSGGGPGMDDPGGPAGVIINMSDEELTKLLDDYISKNERGGGGPTPINGMGNVFVASGRKWKVDPRFMLAVADFESVLGTRGIGADRNNLYGLGGGGNRYPTPEAGIEAGFENVARPDGYYFAQNRFSIADIGAKWAPPGASNDPNGTNSEWPSTVGALYRKLGGNPNSPSMKWDVEGTNAANSDNKNGSRSGGSQGSGSTTVRMSLDPGVLEGDAESALLGIKSAVERAVGASKLDITLTPGLLVIKGKGTTNKKSMQIAASLVYLAIEQWAVIKGTKASNWDGYRIGKWGFDLANGKARGREFSASGKKYILSINENGPSLSQFSIQARNSASPKSRQRGTITAIYTDEEVTANVQRSAERPNSQTANDANSSSGSSPSGASGEQVFTVVIEAGHTPDIFPGSSRNTDEEPKNLKVKAEVERILNQHPKIKVKPLSGSDPRKAQGAAIFVSIHHDSENTHPMISGVSANSVAADGKGLPNTTLGADARSESVLARISKDIHKNESLIKHSTLLLKAMKKRMDEYQTTQVITDNKRMANYYGFYAAKAKAAVIVECGPYKSSSTPSMELAGKIAQGIIDYVESGNAAGAGGEGDDTPASKLLSSLLTTAEYNNGGAGWGPLGYSMEDRNTGVSLAEVRERNLNTDCSSFVANGMIEAGLVPTQPIYHRTTVTFIQDCGVENTVDRANLKAGHFLIKGGLGGEGASGHIMVYAGNGKVVECTSTLRGGKKKGPCIDSFENRFNSEYAIYEHPLVGTTDNPPSGGGAVGGGSGGEGGGGGEVTILTPSGVLNSMFQFPGDVLTSITYTGARAIENDVKLLSVVSDVAKASLRSFASHPNGDFMAWFPDYFNVSNRTPYIMIKDVEIIDCTINLSDTNLATHVFLTADLQGITMGGGSLPREGNQINHLMGQSGIVSIEHAYLLDTFLVKSENRDELIFNLSGGEKGQQDRGEEAEEGSEDERGGNEDPAIDVEANEDITNFLNRYGARPFPIQQPVIRHPWMAFFIAYQTFQMKWAEQFSSNVTFTFMPELFPGTIVGLESLGVQFYCNEVVHSFDYKGGFSTSAQLMAPSVADSPKDGITNLGLSLLKGGLQKVGEEAEEAAAQIAPKIVKGNKNKAKKPKPSTRGGTTGRNRRERG